MYTHPDIHRTKAQFLIFAAFCLVLACKTKSSSQTTQATSITGATEKPVQPSQTAYPTEPGTCVIQGYIINILPIDKTAGDEPCKSFACKANVIITKSHSCGYGVHKKPVEGDTLQINFIHSLAPGNEVKKVYPAKVNLPGLKVDQAFEAQLKIKLLPMDKLSYEIGFYEVLR